MIKIPTLGIPITVKYPVGCLTPPLLLWPRESTATLTMLGWYSWSITGQMHGRQFVLFILGLIFQSCRFGFGIMLFFTRQTLVMIFNMRWYLDMRISIGNEAYSAKLAIIISYPTSVSGIIVLLKNPSKLWKTRPQKFTCTLSIFVGHGIMAHVPWLLSQSNSLNCIIQWPSF